MGSKGRHLEELSLTLLTNKKQENWTKYMLLTLLRQHKLALTTRNAQSLGHLKNLKTGRVYYLGLYM